MAAHLVLIPSYNTGPRLRQTVQEARAARSPVWVIVDGSTDRSADDLKAMAMDDAGLEVFVLPANVGKGAAVRFGVELAMAQGFTHVLVMDADGQHPASEIEVFMAASRAEPRAAVFGLPQFGADAPLLRVRGRRISNVLMRIETLGAGTGDCLFGFRIYPIRPLLQTFKQTRWMRRFDFDPEAAVRLSWLGVPIISVPAPVRYLRAEDGGVSHFRYGRDNVLLSWMHVRLLLGMLPRAPVLVWRHVALWLGRR